MYYGWEGKKQKQKLGGGGICPNRIALINMINVGEWFSE